MPKRKQDDNWEYFNNIKKKMKKLERKILKRSRKFSSSTDSVQLSNDPQADNNEPVNVDYENEQLSEPSLPASVLPAGAERSSDITNATALGEAPPSSLREGASGNNGVSQTELDDFLLEILGKDPSNTITFGKNIQNDLAMRFNFIATTGLTKELRKELIDAHLIPDNCRMIAAPSLNPEIKAAVTEQVEKRDKAMEAKQKQMSSAITCLSEAITLLLENKYKDTTILKLLIDAGRIICDSQYNESMTRRNFILAVLKNDLKDQMLLTKIDSFLFGKELVETLKTAKAINKSGADLKDSAPNKSNTTKSKPNVSNKNLNWKASAQNRRQPLPLPQPSSAKESAPPRQQYAPSRTSRQSFSRGRR